jgi:hypothetical protein
LHEPFGVLEHPKWRDQDRQLARLQEVVRTAGTVPESALCRGERFDDETPTGAE